MTGAGSFLVSLDMELHWGIADHTGTAAYRRNLLGSREAIPSLADLFARRDVRATWAVVGMLFARGRRELERMLPTTRPTYDDPVLSPYRLLGGIGADETSDPFHYGRSLIERIAATRGQELATHTFSHYYCLEPGQTAEQFEADLRAARAAGSDFGDVCTSIVLPRNQRNPAYDDVLRRVGVRAVRTTPDRFGLRPTPVGGESKIARAVRLLQTYAKPRASGTPVRLGGGLVALESSVFLRPWTPATSALDAMRVALISTAIMDAAREGRSFHLWWHPHNFGAHPRENFVMLESILDAFVEARRRYGMESMTMAQEAGRALAA